jgi:oxygen-independent coproporphyrinogen-3 oxidase
MDGHRNAESLGLYVSVPFCRAKCSFCNFASGVGRPEDIAHYVSLLCHEIAAIGETAGQLGARLPRRVDTLYFGGGTPSLLSSEQLGRIFAALRTEFQIVDDAEITMEAAPGQIADVLLREAVRLGVNRVSLGVQSFVDKECAAVGRTHTSLDCIAEVRRLRDAGVAEVGIDLIAGLPHQTAQSWEHSLDVAARLALEGALTHTSVYMFEVDEDSRLGREVLGGGARLYAPKVPSEESAAAMYERACAALEEAGFAQYEISNFAWAGESDDAGEHVSRHNRKYWERKPYAGFGLDAHSMLECAKGAVRFANADKLENYRVCGPEVMRVGRSEACEEQIFLGLRLRDGIAAQLLHRADIDDLVEGGFMQFNDDRVKLTVRGMMVSNEVFGRLLEKVPVLN